MLFSNKSYGNIIKKKKKTYKPKKAVGTALFPIDDATQSSRATSVSSTGKPATFAGQALL
jgi:hypothetical protein